MCVVNCYSVARHIICLIHNESIPLPHQPNSEKFPATHLAISQMRSSQISEIPLNSTHFFVSLVNNILVLFEIPRYAAHSPSTRVVLVKFKNRTIKLNYHSFWQCERVSRVQHMQKERMSEAPTMNRFYNRVSHESILTRRATVQRRVTRSISERYVKQGKAPVVTITQSAIKFTLARMLLFLQTNFLLR